MRHLCQERIPEAVQGMAAPHLARRLDPPPPRLLEILLSRHLVLARLAGLHNALEDGRLAKILLLLPRLHPL